MKEMTAPGKLETEMIVRRFLSRYSEILKACLVAIILVLYILCKMKSSGRQVVPEN